VINNTIKNGNNSIIADNEIVLTINAEINTLAITTINVIPIIEKKTIFMAGVVRNCDLDNILLAFFCILTNSAQVTVNVKNVLYIVNIDIFKNKLPTQFGYIYHEFKPLTMNIINNKHEVIINMDTMTRVFMHLD
jgi:hypothetical protein